MQVTLKDKCAESLGRLGGSVPDLLATLIDWLRPLWLIGLWLVALTVFLGITHYLWQRVFTRDIYMVNISNEKGENISLRFLARTREVVKPTRFDRLYEISAPKLEGGFVQELPLIPTGTKLEFKGVDVGKVVKLFDDVLQKTPPRIEGRLAESRGVFQVVVTDNDGKDVHPWTLRISTTDEKYDFRIERLVDRGIYRALYYVHYESPRARARSSAMNSKVTFPSAEALEAYYAGRWHLDAYQTLHSPEELDRAEAYFNTLRQTMPKFHDGLLLLGVTLTEQRKEEEAIGIFEQIEADLASPKDARERERVLHARLFNATAHRKRYRWQDNHIAVTKLQELVSFLQGLGQQETVDAERRDLMRLEVSALSELVSAIGHYQVLLYADSFIPALTDQTAPVDVKLTADEEKEANRRLSGAESQALFAKVRERLLGLHNDKNRDAELAIERLGKLMEKDADWPGERTRYLSLIRNAHGYTLYRFAQALTDDAKFQKLCKQALTELREAEVYQPQNYAILQNLAVVLLDSRYDESGRNLDEARRLLEHSVVLKPRDYYGYQLLAQAILRKADLWGSETLPMDETKKAVTSAEKARSLRPFGKSILPVIIEAYALQWEVAASERPSIEGQIQTVLGTAKRLGAPRLLLQQARIRWLVAQLRQSPNEPEFTKNREQLLKGLAELYAALNESAPVWENQEVARRHEGLTKALKNANFENRKELTWAG